jgi:hypothetical protein
VWSPLAIGDGLTEVIIDSLFASQEGERGRPATYCVSARLHIADYM